jgi:penicillin amidase
MHTFKRILYIGALLFVTAVVAGLLYLTSIKPQYNGTVQLNGLHKLTEVLFDSYGIPHIYAENEEDAYFALGYVHAQDRLFQMEMLRRVATGSLSEIFGKQYVPTDKFFKTLCFEEHAKLSAAKYFNDTTQRFQKAALAYINGINQFIEHGRTPVEFTMLGIPKRKFSRSDIYLVLDYMALNLAQGFKTDPVLSYIQSKLGSKYLKDVDGLSSNPVFKIPARVDTLSGKVKEQTTSEILNSVEEIIPPVTGSNGWLLSSFRSKSGKVLFANDAHIGYAQPCVWYEAHLEYPGTSLYGNYLAGFPFAAIGHSRRMSWGLTMLMNDDIDFYSEKINPSNKFQVRKNGTWKNLQVINKYVKVKNENDKPCVVRISDHGPLVQGVMPEWKYITDDAVACWWTNLKFPNNLLQVTYDLNHASNINETRNAVSQINAPGLNIIYGDAEGNIAWWAAAKLIKRSPSATPLLLMNGSTGKNDPTGYYDFSENPSSVNPSSGLIYNANNQPDSVNGKLIPGYYAPSDRAERLNELLTDRDKYSTEDFQRINVDVISKAATHIAQNILSALSSSVVNKTAVHNKAFYTLLRWNGDHQPKDISPTIYYRLIYYILKLSMVDEIGEDNFNTYLQTHAMKTSLADFINNDNSPWWDNITTKGKTETRQMIFNKAYDMTINDLVKNLDGSTGNWQWGRVHQLEHFHPIGTKKPFNYIFNVGPVPVPGGLETINQAGFTLSDSRKLKITYGPSMRIVLDFANIENSKSILPTGESGNIMSNYYKDQASIYNNGKLRSQRMNRKEIYLKKSGRLVLQPIQ